MMAGIAAESIRKAEKKKGDSFAVAFSLNFALVLACYQLPCFSFSKQRSVCVPVL